jgi:hypothetical protein
VFLDGPHVLQPADLAFGNPLGSLEETGEAVIDPEAAFRGWGFKPTPEDPEPGLVEALEVIKDALSKDTYVVRAWNLACIAVGAVVHFSEMDRACLVSAKERAWLRLSPRW